MGQPAARVGDMHTCPMSDGPKPHIGGPILPTGAPTVLIGGQPAARTGDMCMCAGPPDTIVQGEPTVLIGNSPAARMGDSTIHGGTIASGFPTVLIGKKRGVSVPYEPPDDLPLESPWLDPIDLLMLGGGLLSGLAKGLFRGIGKAATATAATEFQLTKTVAGKLGSRPYLNSPLTIKEIMAGGKPIPDPGRLKGALRWDVPGAFNKSNGTWELVLDPKTNTIYHFLFKGGR